MKIKWGVIGCGGIADRRTIPGMLLADNAELVAVMDANGQLAQKVKEKYGVKYAFTEEKDLLALEEIDAVYIASPVFCHKPQALAAARAKKHILLEKPLALSSGDSIEIAEECQKQGVKLGAGLMMRYHSYHQAMKRLIAEGKLGQIVSMRAQLTCWYPEIPGNWRQDKARSGGGALMDMGIHCVDLLQYISGLQAREVAAFVGNQTFGYSADDSASVLLKMEGGALAYVDANFNIPDAAARCRLEIYGTRGSILAEGTISQVEGGKCEVVLSDDSLGYDAAQDRVDVVPLELDVSFGNMYTKEIEAFGRAIEEDGEPLVSGCDAIRVQKIIEAAYRASEQKTTVSL